MAIGITTTTQAGTKWDITDAYGAKWSTHYGEQGGGYGYCKFSLPRKVGFNYHDIGFGYRLTVRSSTTNIVFDGQIRQIEEISSSGRDRIDITGLGWLIVAQDDELLRHFCDARLNRWKPVTELPKGWYRPDLFTTGTNALGYYIHASNGKDISVNDHTEIQYTFSRDESAQRFKATLSMVLGSGTVFDATVGAIDDTNGYIDYTTDSGEGNLAADMVIYNSTQGKQATISAVDTGTNRITVDVPSSISGWAASDELAVYGPLFYSQIDSVSDAVITYGTDTLVGESNLANGQTLCNLTKKAIATISAFDTGADTITVSDEDHIEGWDDSDVIAVMAPYFEATFSSVAGTTITYSSPVGERVASTATGWVLHNVTEGEYATVASWAIASNQLVVTDAGDITGNWTNGDTLRIYTPLKAVILESDNTVIWPASDWREGAVNQNRTSINVTTTGNPDGLKMRCTCYISGSFNESTFLQFTDVKAYSTTEDVTATMLAKEMVSLLSTSGLDLSSDETDIATSTKVVEPMVFEFTTPAEAMSWACSFGDESGNALAWGVRLNDKKTFYLEAQDRSTVDYRVVRSGSGEVAAMGDVQKSVQQVRAVYTDKLGDQQVSYWLTAPSSYFSGHWRRKSVRLDNIDTEAEAIAAIQIYLDENKDAKTSTKYTINYGAVLDKNGRLVAIEDIKATGGTMIIQDWRSVESGMGRTDIRDRWTKEQIVAVEIDYDARKITLTPASARSSFIRYMAELARLSEL